MSIRDQFPYFQHSNGIYADSAATTHKTKTVIESTVEFLSRDYATVHRSAYQSGSRATSQFESTRNKVATFIGAEQPSQVIFTKGATESLNLLATTLATSKLLAGKEILICGSEHHANLLPWQKLAKERGLQLKVMPLTARGQLHVEQALAMISAHTAIVAIAHVSNALGNHYPIKRFIEAAARNGAISVVDGTQAVAHMPVNFTELDCDFYAFSAHKMYGPTGVGVLVGKSQLLEALPPYQVGGEMVASASYHESSWQPSPLKFEAGTPNIVGVIAFAAAIDFLTACMEQIQAQEHALAQRLYAGLKGIEGINMLGDFGVGLSNIPLVSFTCENVHHHDVALLLDKSSIAVRSGHHCAMPLMETLKLEGTTRVSLAAYNTFAEIDRIVAALQLALTDSEPVVELSSNPTLPIADNIQSARGWDAVYRQIMLAGKRLPLLAQEQRTDKCKVAGCEADVWLQKSAVASGMPQYAAFSPSKIVRGLLAVVLEKANALPAEKQVSYDYHQYLETIGLSRFLSESRQNGINAVIRAIKS